MNPSPGVDISKMTRQVNDIHTIHTIHTSIHTISKRGKRQGARLISGLGTHMGRRLSNQRWNDDWWILLVVGHPFGVIGPRGRWRNGFPQLHKSTTFFEDRKSMVSYRFQIMNLEVNNMFIIQKRIKKGLTSSTVPMPWLVHRYPASPRHTSTYWWHA